MKIRFGFVGIGALVVGIAGCGGAVRNSALRFSDGEQAGPAPVTAVESSPRSPAANATAPMAPSGDFEGASPPAAAPAVPAASAPAAPPAPRAEAEPPVERSPAERPGLGTEWGETRFSQVHEVPFNRASDDPFAITAVRYDDRAGVLALAGHRGGFRRTRAATLLGGWVSLQVRGEDGSVLDTVSVGDQTYVVGRAGERYAIVLSNHTNRRFEAVATVDGLDVISGRPGSRASRGYLLDPYANLTIDGFRQSDDTVAAFRFGKVADSYAAQTGSARDVGVIGVAFFAERGAAREEEARLRETATPFPADDRYARPPF